MKLTIEYEPEAKALLDALDDNVWLVVDDLLSRHAVSGVPRAAAFGDGTHLIEENGVLVTVEYRPSVMVVVEVCIDEDVFKLPTKELLDRPAPVEDEDG